MTYHPTKPQEVIINGRNCIEVDAVKIFEMASLHERMNQPKAEKKPTKKRPTKIRK